MLIKQVNDQTKFIIELRRLNVYETERYLSKLFFNMQHFQLLEFFMKNTHRRLLDNDFIDESFFKELYWLFSVLSLISCESRNYSDDSHFQITSNSCF